MPSISPDQPSAWALMVNPAAGEGKVLALYESWGYRAINEVQPNPQSPPLIAMLRNCTQ